jgi:hypothetical protein
MKSIAYIVSVDKMQDGTVNITISNNHDNRASSSKCGEDVGLCLAATGKIMQTHFASVPFKENEE